MDLDKRNSTDCTRIIGNDDDDGVVVVGQSTTKSGQQLKRRFSRTSTSILIEKSSMESQQQQLPTPPPRMKASDRRSRCFQRAFSCDVTGLADARAEAPSRTCRSQELEMTCVEKDKLLGDRISRGEIVQSSAEESDGGGGGGGSLTAATKGAGIVCSDEDLRLILTEVAQSRRLSGDAKREKMKSNRSLSLDSSFFKLHMKRLQADSPGWLARILNQKEPSAKSSVNGSGNVSTESSSSSSTTSPTMAMNSTSGCNDDPPRKRSGAASKKLDSKTPETIAEDDRSSSSRRESNVSCGGSDDEHSLLLSANTNTHTNNNNNNNNDGDDNLEVNAAAAAAVTTGSEPPRKAASKVVWTEGSVVDAEVLGTAIEIYLTSVNAKKPAAMDSCKCARAPDNDGDNGQPSTGGGPVVSTLKGLFVK